MFYNREIQESLERKSTFPVIAILGPRQSGKTTLVKNHFSKHAFFSLEDLSIREFITSDPKGFLKEHENEFGIILDEFQYAPQILSYIQLEVDEKNRPGYFVLTGSQNFLMNQAITQSLAGRVGILALLPFSLKELKDNKLLHENVLQAIINGGYPRIYSGGVSSPSDLYPDYIQTYVERDVRQLINVGDLRTFQKFLALCAGRIGQLLNLSDIATNCGISVPTAQKWISILEASYILFLLQPHFNNFNKRLVKTPKLYFYDTGVASNLLGITSDKILSLSPFRGPLFENMIIADIGKQFFNRGMRSPLYFWRDQNDRLEVDCIIDVEAKLFPVEIKSSQTPSIGYFNTLEKWNEIAQTSASDNYVVYAGDTNQERKKGTMIGWRRAADLVELIYKNLA